MEKLRRWLAGEFTCAKCGLTHHVPTFGFGKSICPDCYQGEDEFITRDTSYRLNRLMDRISNPRRAARQ